MGRSPCCSKEGMNRGAWTALEDKILTDYIKAHGEGRWRNLPQKSGLKRCGKSCRLRWLNYLRPDIKRGNISVDEEDLIIRLHKLLGNRWSLIAGRLPGRTDNEIKNYWNTNLVKKVHQNSPPHPDHSNHNHHSNYKTKKKPIIEPPPPNIEPPPFFVHTNPITTNNIIIINPVPEKVDHVRPMLRDNISVDDLVDYGSSYNNGSLSSLDGSEDAVPENFMVDLTMGDVQLSDLLNNSEFSDFFEFNCIKSDNNVDDHNNNPSSSRSQSPWPQPLPSSDLVFSNEILEDWALCDQNVASNLNSLSSFLDSSEEGDWLYI